MSDLTYKDVQRAVQESIRNLENNVQNLANDMATMKTQNQALSDIARDLQTLRTNLQQNLGTTADSISFQSAPNMSNLENTITQIQNDVQGLKNQSS